MSDNVELVILENVSIKKGEIDFGLYSFGNVGSYEFKFINNFNDHLADGLPFIYGENDELLVMTAEDNMITIVHKMNKRDQGAWIDSESCN